jgi:rubrerythrin
LARLEKDEAFKRDEVTKWECRNCGYIHEGKNPPENCPACQHPKAYFEEKQENY